MAENEDVWVWTDTGIACLPDVDAFGDPQPGDLLTDEHYKLIQDEVTGECDHETLEGMGFIEKKSMAEATAAACSVAEAAQEALKAKVEEKKQPVMRQLWEMTDEEFEQVPKITPGHERPRFRNRKVHREAAATDLPGRHFGLVFPYTIDGIREAGAEWLTKAFHTAGTLPLDNRVVSCQVIPLSLNPLAGEALGGSSIKCRVEVTYERQEDGLHNKLFGKIPLEPTDTSERFEHHKWFIDEPETMFNRLMSDSCPFRIPKTYFTDHCPASTNFIHLCEWIEYSQEHEPKKAFQVCKANLKCRDYDLPKMGVERYLAFFRSLGRLVAKYWSGALGPHIRLGQVFENVWPSLDAGYSSGWPRNAEERAFIAQASKTPEYQQNVMKQGEMSLNLSIVQTTTGMDFVCNIAPQLFAKEVTDHKFVLRMMKELAEVYQYGQEIDSYMTQYPECFSLFHPNVQLDNAFYFYKDENCTQMEAGVFDWGGAQCMAYVSSMAGNLQSGAEPAMLDEHEPEVVRAWVDAYHEEGGSERLTFEYIYECFKLAQCKAASGSLGFIVNLLKDVPRNHELWTTVKSRFEPDIEDNYIRRALVGQIDHTLQAWYSKKRDNFGKFKKWCKDNSDIVFKKPPLEHEIAIPKPPKPKAKAK